MKKKKVNKLDFDPELMKMYMMGGASGTYSQKFEGGSDIIDLHLTDGVRKNVSSEDALFYQLDQFEKAMEKAMASGKLEFRVVHGIGAGKLKAAICKILDKHPHVKSYSSEYHSRYGYGSTLIQFF